MEILRLNVRWSLRFRLEVFSSATYTSLSYILVKVLPGCSELSPSSNDSRPLFLCAPTALFLRLALQEELLPEVQVQLAATDLNATRDIPSMGAGYS